MMNDRSQLTRPRPAPMRPGSSRREYHAVLQAYQAVQHRNAQLETAAQRSVNPPVSGTATSTPSAPPAATPPAPRTLIPGRALRSRDALDHSLPIAKVILAVVCWANSFATTAVTFAQVEGLIWRHQHGAAPAPVAWRGFAAGMVFQIFLTAIQIYTAERSPRVYQLSLLPDAGLTALQWSQWLLWPASSALLSLVLPPTQAWWASLLCCVILGWIIGAASARLPEELVFGPRRG